MEKTIWSSMLLFILVFGCGKEDNLNSEGLELKIERLNIEIDQIIGVSTGETSADCRIEYISGGNGCGPIFVYGILGIDTLQLGELFESLSESQTQLYNLEGGPVCDLAFPAQDSLINGKCVGCYPSQEGLDCISN